MSFAPPLIDGNQGVFFHTNWYAPYDTSAAGSDKFDIAYTDLVPSTHGTPNILITSTTICIHGAQRPNAGESFIKVEAPNSDTDSVWKVLCTVYDGQYEKQQNHVPGIRMTPSQNLCMQNCWHAYLAGEHPFGYDTLRRFTTQVVYTLEA